MSEVTRVDLDTAAASPDWLARTTVRPIRDDEVPQLEWEGRYTKYRLIYQQVLERAERGTAVMWGAALPEAGIIGQAFVQLESVARPQFADGSERAYVHSFRVRPEFQNGGLGGKILETLEADLIARHYTLVTLNVVRENDGALRFYKRHGYRITGPDTGRWSFSDPDGKLHHIHEPGWRMEKRLEDRLHKG